MFEHTLHHIQTEVPTDVVMHDAPSTHMPSADWNVYLENKSKL
jgi:hypothetical protein